MTMFNKDNWSEAFWYSLYGTTVICGMITKEARKALAKFL